MKEFIEIEKRAREAAKSAVVTTIDHVYLETQPIAIPKIELFKFDGNYMKVKEFQDLFSTLVIKQSIPDIQKNVVSKNVYNT